MLLDRPTTHTLEEMLDKFAVKELIEYERFCRDNALWEKMHTCFAEDSTVRISWYQGTGHGFVDASRGMKMRAPHKLNSTLVWLHGGRAAAVTMGCIQSRKVLDGAAMDLTSYARFLYTARRENRIWKVVSMDCIYEKDTLTPAGPAPFPPGERESYANLTRVIGAEGYGIAPDLPGDDRPELVEALYQKASGWLETGEASL